MHIPPIIQNILHSTRDALDRPDGRDLFLYSVDDDSYEKLREYLKTLGDINANIGMRGACAAFVLFASEWWTREYQGGVWQWERIFLSAGLPSASASIRSQIVVEGLHFWGHNVEGHGKKFFRAVIRQAAVPLFYANHSKIKALLSRALREAISQDLNQEEIEQRMLANAQATEFNTKDESFQHVLAQLALDVRSMVEVAKTIRVSRASNPMGEPSLLSSWRSKMSASHSSLRKSFGLLDELEAIMSEQQDSRPPPLLHVERYLAQKDVGSPWTFHAQVHARAKASILNVHRHFEMLDASGKAAFELPHYFSIESAPDVEVASARIANGEIQYNDQIAEVSFDISNFSLEGLPACSQQRAELRGPRGSPASSKVNLFGGEEVLLDEILFFAPVDGQLRFIGTSFGKFKNDVVHAVFRDDLWRISANGEGSHVDEADCFVQIGPHYLLHVLIRGEASITALGSNNECSGLILTGCGDLTLSRDASFRWQGAQLSFAPLNSYIGTPKLFIQDSDGCSVEASRDDLYARPVGSSLPLAPLAECCGPLDVYWENDGVRKAKFRLTIFRLANDDVGVVGATSLFRPSWSKSEHCSITLNVKGAREASPSNLVGTGVAFSAFLPKLTFDTAHHTSIPEFIELDLRWIISSRTTKIRIPFPQSGARFYSSNGTAIPQGGNLSRTSLFGSRLRLFSCQPSRHSKHFLTFKLPASSCESFEFNSIDLQTEIRMIDFLPVVDRLFGLSDSLDAEVSVSVETDGRFSARIRISRYDAIFDRDYSGFFLQPATMAKMSPDEMGQIGVLAYSISGGGPNGLAETHAVHLTQETSELAPCGRWVCNDELLPPELAPWLIVPTPPSTLRFRPMIWSFSSPDAPTNSRSILAAAMSDPDRSSRMNMLSQAVASLSSDLSSTLWSEIVNNFEALGSSPLSSLDVFRAVGRDPKASASLLFKMDQDPRSMRELVSRMRSELGVLWEGIPFAAWNASASSFLTYLRSIPTIEESSLLRIFNGQLDAIFTAIPAISLQLEFIRFALIGMAPGLKYSKVFASCAQSKPLLSGKTISEFSSMRNDYLFLPFSDQLWPREIDGSFLLEMKTRFFKEAQALSDERQHQLHRLIEPLLFQESDFKKPVSDAPILLSFWTSLSLDSSWLSLPCNQHCLDVLRAFAPHWFINAYRAGCSACFASGLSTAHLSQGMP